MIEWTQIHPSWYDDRFNYEACAISDNNKLFVCASFALTCLYLKDSSWNDENTVVNGYSLQNCDISADGTSLITFDSAGEHAKIWIKRNGIWNYHQPFGDGVIQGQATTKVNKNGTKYIVAVHNKRLWTYDNSDWIEQKPAGDYNKYWYGCDVSPDGTKFIAGVYDGRLYLYNGSWSELQPIGNNDGKWRHIEFSGDGNRILALDNTKRAWIYDFNSWTELRPKGDIDSYWSIGAINYDGSKIILYDYTTIYLFNNNVWIDITPTGTYFRTINMNSDCSMIIAGEYSHGKLWLGTETDSYIPQVSLI
jgi:hypothetical protein